MVIMSAYGKNEINSAKSTPKLDYEHNNNHFLMRKDLNFIQRRKESLCLYVSNFFHLQYWIRARVSHNKCDWSQSCAYCHGKLCQSLRKIERFKVKDQQQQTELGGTEYLDITLN
jgi:hypothetical protein